MSVNELRIIVALERIVSRVSGNKYLADHLIFKGGFVLFKIYDSSRFTRDIDALGKDVDIARIKGLVPEVLSRNINDGVWFGDVQVQELIHQGDYGGLRFNLAFQIGDRTQEEKKIRKFPRVHFDIGVGDFIPDDLKDTHTQLLTDEKESLTWKIYPAEFIFSEKLQTLVRLGSENSRAKDVYDLLWLFDRCNSELDLKFAIGKTFQQRETDIPNSWSDFFGSLSPDLIKKSWGAVQIVDSTLSYEQAWPKLREVFKKLPEI